MANKRIEQQLEQLTALRAGSGDEAVPVLRKSLADRVNVVVARAAKIAGEMGLRQLTGDLLQAFDRLFEKPVERDPQCWGKTAIGKALANLDYRESAPFLRGVGHVQMEAVWGGRQDSATQLRGTCLLALVSCADITREELLRCQVNHLAERWEPAATVRVESARALEQMEGAEPALLLRLKALEGDRDPAVFGQVVESLLKLESSEAVPFAGRFLEAPEDQIREEAALALGASQLESAFGELKSCWERRHDPVMLRGIGLSRLEAASTFLFSILKRGREDEAKAAITALAVRSGSAAAAAEVRQAVDERGDEAIIREFERQFRSRGD